MEIEVRETSTKKVKVELPYYSKSNCHFFKVIAKDHSICIHEGHESCSIEKRYHSTSCFDSDNKPSNEQEFSEAFERISQRLRDEAFPVSELDKAAEIKAVNDSQ